MGVNLHVSSPTCSGEGSGLEVRQEGTGKAGGGRTCSDKSQAASRPIKLFSGPQQ